MPTEQLTHPTYRRDIDGLRAIAVLAVVAFHAAPGRLPGGFIGVDIFFVISGYLITTIIANNLANHTFSFSEFYRRRIRRIFPALLVVLFACLIFGSLLLTPEQYQNLGKHIAGGAGFSANFLLWTESGYFDNASEMKPLLHLWSLAIEEQFYIIWPLLLWFVFKKKKSWLITTVVILTFSFLLNIYTAKVGSPTAFYSPLSRFWELLVGALLAYILINRTNRLAGNHPALSNLISCSGALLIITGLLFITKDRSFPGWWAVLPVLGTGCIILAGSQTWFNRAVLSNSMLVWFGLISYPLYLTHWPIISFLRIMEGKEITQVNRFYAVLASIGLSWLIFKFIEKPIRYGRYSLFKITALVLLMSTIGGYGFYIFTQNGNVVRLGPQPKIVNIGDIGQRPFFEYMSNKFYTCTPASIQKDMGFWEEFQRCYQSKKEIKKHVAVIGDSHAEHLFIGLAEELPNLNVVYYAKGGMPFLNNKKYDEIFKSVVTDHDIKVVFISAHWARDLRAIEAKQIENNFTALLKMLVAAKKTVYIVDDVPQFTFTPGKCKYTERMGMKNTCSQGIEAFNEDRLNYYPVFILMTERFANVQILETKDFFCNNNECSMAGDGVLYYRDSHHLNVTGSQKFWHYIFQNSQIGQDIERVIDK